MTWAGSMFKSEGLGFASRSFAATPAGESSAGGVAARGEPVLPAPLPGIAEAGGGEPHHLPGAGG